MNYVTKTCESCNKPFKVSEEWQHVKMCIVCYNLKKNSLPLENGVKEETQQDRISKMAVWRGICQLRQGKGTPIKKMIEDAKMVYDELFEVKK